MPSGSRLVSPVINSHEFFHFELNNWGSVEIYTSTNYDNNPTNVDIATWSYHSTVVNSFDSVFYEVTNYDSYLLGTSAAFMFSNISTNSFNIDQLEFMVPDGGGNGGDSTEYGYATVVGNDVIFSNVGNGYPQDHSNIFGTYNSNSSYNGRTVYKHATEEYYIFWQDGSPQFIIALSIGGEQILYNPDESLMVPEGMFYQVEDSCEYVTTIVWDGSSNAVIVQSNEFLNATSWSDMAGLYNENVIYNDQMSYKHSSLEYYIFVRIDTNMESPYDVFTNWVIGNSLGGGEYLHKHDGSQFDPTGDYYGGGGGNGGDGPEYNPVLSLSMVVTDTYDLTYIGSNSGYQYNNMLGTYTYHSDYNGASVYKHQSAEYYIYAGDGYWALGTSIGDMATQLGGGGMEGDPVGPYFSGMDINFMVSTSAGGSNPVTDGTANFITFYGGNDAGSLTNIISGVKSNALVDIEMDEWYPYMKIEVSNSSFPGLGSVEGPFGIWMQYNGTEEGFEVVLGQATTLYAPHEGGAVTLTLFDDLGAPIDIGEVTVKIIGSENGVNTKYYFQTNMMLAWNAELYVPFPFDDTAFPTVNFFEVEVNILDRPLLIGAARGPFSYWQGMPVTAIRLGQTIDYPLDSGLNIQFNVQFVPAVTNGQVTVIAADGLYLQQQALSNMSGVWSGMASAADALLVSVPGYVPQVVAIKDDVKNLKDALKGNASYYIQSNNTWIGSPYFSNVYSLSLETGRTLPTAQWQMATFPYQLSTNTEEYLFGGMPYLDTNGQTNAGLPPQVDTYRWVQSLDDYILASSAEVGKSFFINMADAVPLEIADNSTYTIPTEQNVTLSEGWNMLGNPFLWPFNSGSVRVVDAAAGAEYVLDEAHQMGLIEHPMYVYNGTGYDIVNTPKVYDGFWMWVTPQGASNNISLKYYNGMYDDNAGEVLTSVPAQNAAKLAAKAPGAAQSSGPVMFNVSATVDGLKDTDNVFGWSLAAQDGVDPSDLHEPPVHENYLSLAFIGTGDTLSTDMRAESSEVKEWPFVITTDKKRANVELKFSTIANQDGYTLLLLDVATGDIIEINGDKTLSFAMTTGVRSFKLMAAGIGDDSILTEDLDFNEVYAYPNPAIDNATIRAELSGYTDADMIVKIYDADYNLVKQATMINSEAKVWTYQWNFGDERGVNPGMYIYKVSLLGYGDDNEPLELTGRIGIIR